MTANGRTALILGALLVAGPFALDAGGPDASAAAATKGPSPALVELGRRLFMDPNASRQGGHSCASCHDPEKAFSDARPRSPDDRGPTLRHSQTLLDLGGEGFHWDGEFETVRQLLVARVAPAAMANAQAQSLAKKRLHAAMQSPDDLTKDGALEIRTVDGARTRRAVRGYGVVEPDDVPVTPVAERLAEDGLYANSFREAFGDPAITIERTLDAMDAYCASIRSTTSAFDRFRAGDDAALSPGAKHGLALFEGRAGCASCHLTKADGGRAPFTDGKFHDTGVALRTREKTAVVDFGRGGVTFLKSRKEQFKTPTLRDVAGRGPYMHDASFETLTDVVKYYSGVERSDAELDPALHRADLTDTETDDVVAFLQSLTGDSRPALGFPPRERRTLRLRVENLAGKPVSNLAVDVRPFGDRLEGADTIRATVRVFTDAKGVAEIRLPLSTHVLLTNRTHEIGLTRPIPDSAGTLTLIATPRDTVSLRIRRTDAGPRLPGELPAFIDGTPMRKPDGTPAKPSLLLKKVRDLSLDEALYSAKSPGGSETRRVSLVFSDGSSVRCDLDFSGGASETLVLAAAKQEETESTPVPSEPR